MKGKKRRVNLWMGPLESLEDVGKNQFYFLTLASYIMINSMIWNIMGMVNKPSIRRTRKLIKLYKLAFFAIIEPKASTDCLQEYQRLFSCHGACGNDKGTIWVFWRENINVKTISFTEQCIHLELFHPYLASVITITVVYASSDARERRSLWDQLISFNCSAPWMVAGDFNIVAS